MCTLSLPNGVRVDALVDTGSVVNVMNKELWKVIGSPELTETKDKFVSVNRGKMNVLGKCTVNTLVKGKDKDCVFYVFDEEIKQPIMGWEGLTKFGGEISLEKGTWEPGNQRGICAIARFLSEDKKEKDLEGAFEKFPKVFCQRMEKAGQCTAGEGETELLNDTPVNTALPPVLQAMKEELRVLVKEMLSRGVIEKSTSIEFLGHLIDDKGVHITEFMTEKMKNYPIPRNPKEAQRAMGLFNYVRRFIPNFSDSTADHAVGEERSEVCVDWRVPEGMGHAEGEGNTSTHSGLSAIRTTVRASHRRI